MKWTVLALLAAGSIVAVGIVVLLSSGALSPEPEGYATLWRVRDGLPASLGELESLATRDDAVGWQARVLAGRTYAAAGDFSTAARWLGAALESRATSDLRLEFATCLEAAGERDEALDQWKKLLPRDEAVDAVRRLEPDPTQRAAWLVGAGRPTEALSLVTPPANADARLTRARALAALGRMGEAVEEYERYLQSRPGSDSIRLEYGRALERSGATDTALAVYATLGSPGAYRAGTLIETLGRRREAAEAYLRSSDSESRWCGARLLEALGEETRALAVYRDLAVGSHRVHDDAALRAYVLSLRNGEKSKAEEMADRLSPAFRWILGRYVPPSAVLDSASRVRPEALRVADAVLRRESMSWAVAEVEFALRTADAEDRLAIAAWYEGHGDVHRAFEIAAPLLSVAPSRAAYALAYPHAWREAVERWAKAYGVDPWLVFAVMREESNFLPTAVSSSDARGLMQLLPTTARWVAQTKLGISYRDDDLFDPETNIRLGTWYLSSLLKQFDGDVVRAVAAYNGGPGNVERWVAAAGTPSAADFPGLVARIETREYVVKVLNAWLTYTWLEASGSRE